MPVVPRLVDPIADQLPYAREQAHHFPGAFGRGLGNALAGVGKSIDHAAGSAARIVIQEQDKDNDREAKEMDARLTRAWRERLYGENGFYNQQGTNAVAASGAIKQELEKLRGEIRGTASNPLVGEMFDMASTFRMERELESIDRFASKERKVANVLAMETRAKEAVEDAMVRWNDPEALARSEHILKHETLNMAEEMGWEPEVAQSKLEEGLSNIYLGAVEMALSSGSASDAKQMFAQYSDKLDAKGTAAAVKAIKQMERSEAAEARSIRAEQRSMIAFAQSQEDRKRVLQERIDKQYNEELAQQITNEYADLSLPYDAQVKEASKIVDIQLREEVERRLVNANLLQERAQADMAREVGRELNSLVAQGTTYEAALGQLSSEKQQYLYANPSLIENAQRIERAYAEDQLYANASDNKTLREIQALPPSEQARIDTNRYLGILTRTEQNQLDKLVNNAAKYLKDADSAAVQMIDKAEDSLWQQLKGNELFADGSKPTEHFNRVITDLKDWVFLEADQKRMPTEREVRQKAAQLATVYEADTGAWWNPFGGSTQGTARDLSPEQQQVARVPLASIPTNILTEITNDLTGVGVKTADIPDSLLEEMAAAFFLGQRDRYMKLLNSAKE